MSDDISGNLPLGKLTWRKPSQYKETYESKTLTEYYMCRAGEAYALIPSIFNPAGGTGGGVPVKQGMFLSDISVETHESNKVDFVTLTYSADAANEPEPDDPDNPEDPTWEFDGSECEITTSCVDEPITQCKLYKSQVDALDNTTLTDLCALMGGQLADEKGTKLTDKLNDKVPPSLLSKILRGQTHYKAAYTQVRLTIPGKVSIADTGKISTRAGLPSLPDGQVYLCCGGGQTRRNGKTVTQITYIGGNWDTEIYS